MQEKLLDTPLVWV